MFKKPHRKGAPCPAYSFASVSEMFRRYEREMVGHVTDPLGTRVYFRDYNFPKLIQLHYQGTKAKASKVLQYLRGGQVDDTCYTFDQNRASTLLWIPDIIQDPDSIHTNAHGLILGDEVYIKAYAKARAQYKIVFTEIYKVLNQRIVTTSFFTHEDRLSRLVTMPAKWMKRPESHEGPGETPAGENG